ncbi:hypothetical protein D3C72_2171250 [compost metagenome]
MKTATMTGGPTRLVGKVASGSTFKSWAMPRAGKRMPKNSMTRKPALSASARERPSAPDQWCQPMEAIAETIRTRGSRRPIDQAGGVRGIGN